MRCRQGGWEVPFARSSMQTSTVLGVFLENEHPELSHDLVKIVAASSQCNLSLPLILVILMKDADMVIDRLSIKPDSFPVGNSHIVIFCTRATTLLLISYIYLPP